MTLDPARTRLPFPSRRARLGAAVLLTSAAVLTGCGAGGSDGGATTSSSSDAAAAAASSTSASPTEASSSTSTASGSTSTSASTSSSSSAAGAPPLPGGVNADVELPENEKVLALKEPMAEVLGLQGDVTVDTTATGEFSILRSQQQEAATATDAEAEEMRAASLPLADDACWAAQGEVSGLLAESGGTEVSYGGTRAEPAEGAEETGPDTSALITTLPDEGAAAKVQQAEQDRAKTCEGNADYAAAITTERTTVDGVDYDVTTTTATEDGAGPMPGISVMTRDGARLIAVTALDSAGEKATPEQVVEMAQGVREAVAKEFGPAS